MDKIKKTIFITVIALSLTALLGIALNIVEYDGAYESPDESLLAASEVFAPRIGLYEQGIENNALSEEKHSEAESENTGEADKPAKHYISWRFAAYEEPDVMSEKKGEYEPQAVQISEKKDDGWALINTHNGKWWVYLKDNLRYIDKYSCVYNDISDKIPIDVISPQIVKVIGQDGDRLKIQTELGPVWLFTSEKKEFLALVDKSTALDKNYVPNDLTLTIDGQYLRKEAADAFLDMRTQMDKEGLYLTARSGYRSYQTQQYLFRRASNAYGLANAEIWNARAGHSEHQTGLAIDILQRGFTGSPLSSAKFQNTKHYEWLLKNAHMYGFILRYPKGLEEVTGISYEPWHWRYVGVEHAFIMNKTDLKALEQYLDFQYVPQTKKQTQ